MFKLLHLRAAPLASTKLGAKERERERESEGISGDEKSTVRGGER